MKTITLRRNLVIGIIILFIASFAVPSINGADHSRVFPASSHAVSDDGGIVAGGCKDGNPDGFVVPFAKIKIVPRVWWTWWQYFPPGMGGDVLCYIGNLPEGYSVSEIDLTSILLNGTVPITEGSDMLLPSHPGFVDSVLQVGFNKRDALLSLGLGGKDSSPGHRVKVEGWMPAQECGFYGFTSIKVRGLKESPFDRMATTNHGTPHGFELFQNHPNPFNPETEISYNLPNDAYVNLTILNILGQKVKTLVDEFQQAGHKTAHWDGKDDEGNKVSSGIYFYRIQAGDYSQTKKMVLTK